MNYQQEIDSTVESISECFRMNNDVDRNQHHSRDRLNMIYFRLRATDSRLKEEITFLTGQLRYNTENSFSTSSTSKRFGKDFQMTLLSEYLKEDALQHLPIHDVEEKHIWLKQIEIVNTLGDAELMRLFVDTDEVSKHVLYLYDTVRYLSEALTRQKANRIVLIEVAGKFAASMQNQEETVVDYDIVERIAQL